MRLRQAQLVLPVAALVGLAMGVLSVCVLFLNSGSAAVAGNVCEEPQGSSSIGVFYSGGEGAIRWPRLYDIDLYGKEKEHAFPVANPVLTAANAGSPISSVSSPVLFEKDAKLYMFFTALICPEGRTHIAAAESTDGGSTWKGLGPALQEASFPLSAPFVFEHKGAVYMIPSSPDAGEVRLYKASSFPKKWKLAATLLNAHLHNPSVIERPDGAGWMLMASRSSRGGGSGGEDAILEVYLSKGSGTKGLTGTWRRHPASPAAVESATQAGRLLRVGGGLYRFGRSCVRGQCGPINAFMLHVGPETFEQDQVELQLGRTFWRQLSAWNGAGHTHLDILPQPHGNWIAAASGRRLPAQQPPLAGQLETLLLLLRVAAAAAALAAVWATLSGMEIVRHLLLQRPWGQRMVRRFSMDGVSPKGQLCSTPPSRGSISIKAYHDDTPEKGASLDLEQPFGGSSGKLHLRRSATFLGLRPTTWRALCFAALAVAALAGISGGRYTQTVMEPFWAPTAAVAVDGAFSRYTIMVMSYESRLSSLKWAVQHYSQCPSAGEVLVIWNKGVPPDPRRDLESRVPVRVRVEASNSMNNRFRPDARIRFRGVFSLDDDTMVPCSTVEAAFAAWRLRPRRLVGIFPLLLEADVPGGPILFRGERHAIERGQFNMVEPGAAFMDSQSAFAAYYADAVAAGRALVDETMNCDDILLNMVLANTTAAALTGAGPSAVPQPAVQWLRPERRLDISRLSGVGLSHDYSKFKADAEKCLAAFSELFGGNPLQAHAFEWGRSAKPRCSTTGLWCTYT